MWFIYYPPKPVNHPACFLLGVDDEIGSSTSPKQIELLAQEIINIRKNTNSYYIYDESMARKVKHVCGHFVPDILCGPNDAGSYEVDMVYGVGFSHWGIHIGERPKNAHEGWIRQISTNIYIMWLD